MQIQLGALSGVSSCILDYVTLCHFASVYDLFTFPLFTALRWHFGDLEGCISTFFTMSRGSLFTLNTSRCKLAYTTSNTLKNYQQNDSTVKLPIQTLTIPSFACLQSVIVLEDLRGGFLEGLSSHAEQEASGSHVEIDGHHPVLQVVGGLAP